jgi:transketolase
MTNIRLIANNIRKNIITAVYNAQSGHPGGSLGIADILAVLYFRIMDIDPLNPNKKDRDRFVLSKGHCAPALYSALAERGYFSKEQIKTYRSMGSILQGHPDCNCTFGWNVIEIDGHDHEMIFNALNVNNTKNDKPFAIIAKTVKGKGVSFMENKVEWHGSPPNREQYETAMKELNEIEQKIMEKNE